MSLLGREWAKRGGGFFSTKYTMGNVCFCSCSKDEEVLSDETGPLLVTNADQEDNGNWERASKEREEKFYKSVVDEAQGRFLNSSFRHHHSRTREDSNGVVQELRTKLSAMHIDEVELNACMKEGFKWRSEKSATSVVDLLSEPLASSSYILDVDRVADEVAELVSQHVHIRIDDSNATVVSFKPVSSST